MREKPLKGLQLPRTGTRCALQTQVASARCWSSRSRRTRLFCTASGSRQPGGCGPGALPLSGLQALSSLCQDLPPAPQLLKVYTHHEVGSTSCYHLKSGIQCVNSPWGERGGDGQTAAKPETLRVSQCAPGARRRQEQAVAAQEAGPVPESK